MPQRRIVWTNKSVLKFAGEADPILAMEAKARDLVLRARDHGWSGPPYNPIAIADLLKIRVEANSDVIDARTVPAKGGVLIEFNPTRPRERVRFSVAHEIAHTLFADVADETRHRGGSGSTSDEWQLELLCNLAAAEFVMPLGSLPPSERLPKIEVLMMERRKFDVSAEAFLMRMVKTTSEAALMFCASPTESAQARHRYRIDYCIGSKSAPVVLGAGTLIPNESIVYGCTAIGQTNRATETWITDQPLETECVGIPSFPGSTYPRIGGIVRFANTDSEQDGFKIVHGDVLKPIGGGPKIICQLINDQAKTWGGGVARSTAKKYPQAQQTFASWITQLRRRERLGRVHFSEIDSNLTIASLIAQEGFGASSEPRIRYAPLAQAFSAVAEFAIEHKATVHMPRIGAGQSGGAWNTVEDIVRDTLVAQGVSVTVYDLPPKRQGAQAELFT
ncbi:ImmA/IrrE family metallo-endopeptidase [Bradyrhizobium sp. NBAIM02]|uniref:ImmA/IrrE family metallo-endopeptidase n=1 Tax=Bradyrhizobium sp. NBAIM02 TaxID=2793817 RepID=UPI001CD7A0A4